MISIAKDGTGDIVGGFYKEDMTTSSYTTGGNVGVVSAVMKDEEMNRDDDTGGTSQQQLQQQLGNESTGERLPKEKILLAGVKNDMEKVVEDKEEGLDNSVEATIEKEENNSPFVAFDDLGKGGISRKNSSCTSPSLEGKLKDAKDHDRAVKGEGKGEDTSAVLSKRRPWGGNESHRLRISFLKPPPPSPFEGKPFEVECVLCNEKAKSTEVEQSLSSRKVRISPTFLTPEGDLSDFPLELESTTMSWNDGGLLATLKFHANILKNSAPISSRRVCIMLSTEYGLSAEDGDEPVGVIKLEPLVSEVFVVVKHALEIVDGEMPIPDQWFKDEGGRESCVEFGVRLVDSEGCEVLDRNVQLHLTLLYDNMCPVANQDILKVLPCSEWSLGSQNDGAKGKSGGSFRVRIEEVSRHHQKQPFRLRVAAEPVGHERTLDIRPGSSKPITVLSKRISRKSKQKAENKGRLHHDLGNNEQSSPTGGGVSPQYRFIDQKSINLDKMIGRQRASSGQAVPPMGRKGPHGVDVPMDYGFAGPAEISPSAFNHAMRNVISWSEEVVNTLTSIEWKLIGYETLPNNQPNHDRPLYSISNPNPLIANLLSMYVAETTHCLHMLLMYHEERGGMEKGQIPVENSSAGVVGVEGSGSISFQPGGVHVDPQSMAKRNVGQHFLFQYQAQQYHQALSMQQQHQQQQHMKYGKSSPAFMPCEWGGLKHEFQQEQYLRHAETKQGFQVNKRMKRECPPLGEDEKLAVASLA